MAVPTAMPIAIQIPSLMRLLSLGDRCPFATAALTLARCGRLGGGRHDRRARIDWRSVTSSVFAQAPVGRTTLAATLMLLAKLPDAKSIRRHLARNDPVDFARIDGEWRIVGV